MVQIVLDIAFMLTLYNGDDFGCTVLCVTRSGKAEECGKCRRQYMHKNAISPHFVAFED